MARSEKLYSKSPSLKRGEDGNIGISKPKPADKEDMNLSGNPLPGSEGEMPIGIKQVNDMYERHIQEMKDMHKRHENEHKVLAEDHSKLASTESAKVEG